MHSDTAHVRYAARATNQLSRLLQFNRQRVNLRGQNEVVLGEPTDGVSPDFDGRVAVAFDVEVWVVAFFLSQLCYLIEEAHACQEVLDCPLLQDALMVSDDLPALECSVLSFCLFWSQFRDAAFAGNALLATQDLTRLDFFTHCSLRLLWCC